MRILIIGLEGADPELLFGDERLTNIRRLMEFGCFGLLESRHYAGNMAAWIHMAASQEAHAGDDVPSVLGSTIWTQLAGQGKCAILVGVSPPYESPVAVHSRIERLDVAFPLEVVGSGALDENQRLAEIYALSQGRFEAVRHLLGHRQWDYFQFIDRGPSQILQALGDTASRKAIRDYCSYYDDELGATLESLSEDAVVLQVLLQSALGAENVCGGFILAATNNPLEGEIKGARLVDMVPTLLELGGYQIPAHMQGKSLVAGKTLDSADDTDLSAEEEAILRERLSGLGYIS
jgi:hypothetical protein